MPHPKHLRPPLMRPRSTPSVSSSMLIDGAVAVAGLATSTSVHLKGARRGSASTRTHKVLEDYKEMVVEASALPPEGLVVVNLNSLEDLARAAEVLMKSIIKVVDYEG